MGVTVEPSSSEDPKEEAILDGSDTTIFEWTDQGNGVYSTICQPKDVID